MPITATITSNDSYMLVVRTRLVSFANPDGSPAGEHSDTEMEVFAPGTGHTYTPGSDGLLNVWVSELSAEEAIPMLPNAENSFEAFEAYWDRNSDKIVAPAEFKARWDRRVEA